MPSSKKKSKTATSLVNKVYCIRCGSSNQTNFYQTKDVNKKFYGKIPYCKDCIKELYDYYLTKYNNNENMAIYYLCRKIDIPYIHANYQGAVNSLNNPNSKIQGDYAIISAYMKGFAFAEQNNWGASFDESEGESEIQGLSSFAETVKVRKKKKNGDDNEYEVIEYDTDDLLAKWGAFDIDDLIYLQSEYLDWEAKLGGITEKSIDVIVKQVCLQCKDIERDRINGVGVDKKIKTLTTLLNDSGLIEKQNSNMFEGLSVGMLIKDIEHIRPLDTVKDEVKDVDGMHDIMMGMAGGISRTLGKENIYTKAFDDIYGQYSMDLINDIDIEDENNEEEQQDATAPMEDINSYK